MSRFARATRHLDRILIWIGAFGTVWAAMIWVATRLDALGEIGWPEATFLGLGAACAIAISLSLVLIGWRTFRPLIAPSAAPLLAPSGTDSDLSDELADIAASISELREEISAARDAGKAAASNVGDVLGLRIRALNERVDKIATACARLESTVKKLPGKIDVLMERNRERVEGQLAGVDQAFRAILNREWHHRLFGELDRGVELLMEPFHAGKPIENWKQWQENAKGWRGKLDQWLIIADYYAMGTAENVKRLPDNLHDDEVVWSIDESVLTANQIARFKEIATIWHNATDAKPRVDRGLEQAAFNVPTSHRRLDPPPRIGE